jgi:hypothetical protein
MRPLGSLRTASETVSEWHSAAPAATFLYAADAKNEPPLSLRLTAHMKILPPPFASFRLRPRSMRHSFSEHDAPCAPLLPTGNFAYFSLRSFFSPMLPRDCFLLSSHSALGSTLDLR